MLDRAADEVIVTDGSIRDLTDEETDQLIARLKVEIRKCDETAVKGKASRCRAA
jgi:hypothetical protein